MCTRQSNNKTIYILKNIGQFGLTACTKLVFTVIGSELKVSHTYFKHATMIIVLNRSELFTKCGTIFSTTCFTTHYLFAVKC